MIGSYYNLFYVVHVAIILHVCLVSQLKLVDMVFSTFESDFSKNINVWPLSNKIYLFLNLGLTRSDKKVTFY